MEKIMDYLVGRYQPETLILYGSYADGSFNANSDLDAILLADVPETFHDTSVVEGIPLDVFIYPADTSFSPEDFPQLYFSRILIDRQGRGKALQKAVADYIESRPARSDESIREDIVWCEKMLARTKRGDAEGYYRWHWVLCDSLEFYSDIRGWFYFGPKKTLLLMQKHDPVAYALYSNALKHMEYAYLAYWVDFLKRELRG